MISYATRQFDWEISFRHVGKSRKKQKTKMAVSEVGSTLTNQSKDTEPTNLSQLTSIRSHFRKAQENPFGQALHVVERGLGACFMVLSVMMIRKSLKKQTNNF